MHRVTEYYVPHESNDNLEMSISRNAYLGTLRVAKQSSITGVKLDEENVFSRRWGDLKFNVTRWHGTSGGTNQGRVRVLQNDLRTRCGHCKVVSVTRIRAAAC